MLLLRTLGSVALLEHTPAGEQHLDVQQKRLALLVFLARRGRGAFLRRDVLLSLFWPEADEQHGRGVLRQALTAFRKQLGPDVLITHGEDEVGLAPHLVTCDASEFEEACRAGSHEAACALYRGDFLAGFHATGVAVEFEQWVDAERDRLRLLARDAAWSMARACEEAGRDGDAGRWARHAVDLEPDDEAGVARLIGLLDRQGDRSGALAVYAALERRLAADYSAQPAPETRSLKQAMLRRPTPVLRARPDGAEEPAAVLPSTPPTWPSPPSALPQRATLRSRRPLLIAGVIGAMVTIMLVALLGPARPASPAATHAGVLAVVPFRIHASDSELAWLQEGMVELLTMRLSGSEGLSVIEPGRVLAAWHGTARASEGDVSVEELERVADEVDADRVVRGSVSGTPAHLVLAAWVVAMPGGRSLVQASVEGSADSLPFLVDRLSAKLLGLTAGVEGHRLASLEGVPPAAIRAFLGGRAAVRRGRPNDAVVHFREAVAIDSTFAVAGLDLWRTAGWTKCEDDARLGRRVVRANRQRLSAPDRALTDAMLKQWGSAPEMFGTWNAAVAAYPERPETWYGLADSYFHWGMLAGLEDALARADYAFRRGWALDSAANGSAVLAGPLIAETMDHLVVLAHLRGDTAEVLRLVALVHATDSTSDLARKLSWHRAAVLGLQARHAFWEHPPAGDPKVVMGIVLFTLWTPVAAEDHPRAALENQRRYEMHDPGFRSFARYFEAFNGGRPGDAPPADDVEHGLRRALEVGDWWGGDSTAAIEAASQLSRFADGPVVPGGLALAQYADLCRLGLWRAGRGDAAAGAVAARRLRAGRVPGLAAGDSAGSAHDRELCAALLEASGAVALGRYDAAGRLAIADSLARTYIFEVCCGEAVSDANLVLARLWERIGDRPKALRALRRRSGGFLLGPLYMSTFLREEGRLSALTGDTSSAIRAYRHYLALRPDPEPIALAEVELVRKELVVLGPRTLAVRER